MNRARARKTLMTIENPLQSLRGVGRNVAHVWLDGYAKDLVDLEDFSHLTSLSLYRLAKKNVGVLANLSLPKLTALDLRLGPIQDCHSFSQFKKLKELSIWQCSQLLALNGLESLPEIRRLYLSDLGSPLVLDSIEKLSNLEELHISGSVHAPQKVRSFGPIGKIARKLSILELYGSKVLDKDLHALANLPEPNAFSLAPWFYALEDVAVVAAAYPKWRKSLKNMGIDHYKQCVRCGGRLRQTFAYRSRAKCPACDVESFKKFEKDFEDLVKEKEQLLEQHL